MSNYYLARFEAERRYVITKFRRFFIYKSDENYDFTIVDTIESNKFDDYHRGLINRNLSFNHEEVHDNFIQIGDEAKFLYAKYLKEKKIREETYQEVINLIDKYLKIEREEA